MGLKCLLLGCHHELDWQQGTSVPYVCQSCHHSTSDAAEAITMDDRVVRVVAWVMVACCSASIAGLAVWGAFHPKVLW